MHKLLRALTKKQILPLSGQPVTRVIVTTLISLVYPYAANALNVGPYDYNVVQRDMVVEASIPGSKTPLKITLHRGQIMSLHQPTHFSAAWFAVEKKVDGRVINGRVTVPANELRKKFGPPLNPSNTLKLADQDLTERPFDTKNGKFLRLDESPYTLGDYPPLPGNSSTHYLPTQEFPPQSKNGGTQISVKESKVIDVGNGNIQRQLLVHYVCLERSHFSEKCGWVRNDFLSRGDPLNPKYNWQTPDVNSSTAKKACDSRESLGQASQFAIFVKRAIDQLPPGEPLAREAVREALDSCAVPKSMKPLKMKTGRFDKSNENLYQAMAWPNAKQHFDRLGSAASRVMVRGPGGTHPLELEDFLAIDAFARTLYGEMREDRCAKKPYLEATARTILNRAHDPSAGKFRRRTGSATNPILQAIVSDEAYSVWNNDKEVGSKLRRAGRPEVKAVLCPSSQPTSPSEQLTWQRCLDIAIHAVLDKNLFLDETKSLTGLFYYTSFVKGYKGYSPLPAPTLFNYKLDEPTCMKFWKEKPI